MGFWNALSALAPVAPAMSDAKDLRTSREQDATKFTSDQALAQAQLTTRKLAAQAEQQRITQSGQPVIIGEPQWNPTTHTNQILTFDKNTGSLALKDAPGADPAAAAAAQYKAAKSDYKTTTGRDLTPEEDQSLFFQSYGYKPPPAAKFTPLPGAAGQPQLGPDGKSSVVYGRDEAGNVVSKPLDANYKPVVKTPVMKPGIGDGRNTNAYYSMDQKAWIDSNTNQPLRQFAPFSPFSQTGLYGVDTGYDAQGNPVPILLNRRTGQITPAPAGLVAPAQSKGIEAQRTAAIAGDSLLRTMIGGAERAKAGDQQAQLSVVANHIGMTLGAQKGARINQAVWNEATESAPWLENVKKKWGPGGYLQGVTLSPQQVDQMVELGKLRRDVMWQQAAQTAEAAGVPLQIPPFAEKFSGNPTSNAPKGTVALKAGGRVYNIPRGQVAAFRKDHPDASQ